MTSESADTSENVEKPENVSQGEAAVDPKAEQDLPVARQALSDEQIQQIIEAALLAALSSGAQPVVLWSPDASGEFGDIIAATPPALKGLYGPLAIEWRGGIHGAVSVRLVAKALGARATGDGMCECAKRCAAAVVGMAKPTGGSGGCDEPGREDVPRGGEPRGWRWADDMSCFDSSCALGWRRPRLRAVLCPREFGRRARSESSGRARGHTQALYLRQSTA